MAETTVEITEDLLQAWRDFHDDGSSNPMRDPNPEGKTTDAWVDRKTLEGRQRVLGGYSKRRSTNG